MLRSGRRLLWFGLVLLCGCGDSATPEDTEAAESAALAEATAAAWSSGNEGALAASAVSDYRYNGVSAADLGAHTALWLVTGSDLDRVDGATTVEVLAQPAGSRQEPDTTTTMVRLSYRYVRDDLPNGPAGVWVRGSRAEVELIAELTGRREGTEVLLTSFRPIRIEETRRYYYDTDDDPMYDAWIAAGEPAGLGLPPGHRDLILNGVNVALGTEALAAGAPRFSVAPGGALTATWSGDNLERPNEGPGAAPVVLWPDDAYVSVPPYCLGGFRAQPVPDYPNVGANAARDGNQFSVPTGRVVAPAEAGLYTAWISAVNRRLSHLDLAGGRRVGESIENRLTYFVPYRVES